MAGQGQHGLQAIKAKLSESWGLEIPCRNQDAAL